MLISVTAKATVKPPATACDEVTVKFIAVVPALPSVIVGLLMVSVEESSLVIVPVATAPVTMLAAATGTTGVTAPRVTVKVLCGSATRDAGMRTGTVVTVTPGASVTVPPTMAV